jgi:hypothetical protein
MLTKRNGIIILFITIIGLVVWQNYQLRMEQKVSKEHITKTALFAAHFLSSAGTSINTINKQNQWDDLKTRRSLQISLAYSFQSLTIANSTLQDYPSLVPSTFRQNMNDIFFGFDTWYVKVTNILGKEGAVTAEDKVIVSELSGVVSKVDFPQTWNDFNSISASFERFAMEWKISVKQ